MEQIWLRDLPCFKEADTEKGTPAYYVRNGSFEFDLLPTEGIKKEFHSFVLERIEKLTLLSLYVDVRHFILATNFLSENHPELESILDVEQELLIAEFVKWLNKQGIKAVTSKGHETPHVQYLRKVYCFILPDKERPARKRAGCTVKVRNLEPYKNLNLESDSLEHLSGECCYHLDLLPTKELRKEFLSFIEYRASQIKISCQRSDIWQYGVVGQFLSNRYPDMHSLLEQTEEELVKDLKKWLMMNGYSQTTKSYKKIYEKNTYKQSDIISYLRKVYQYLKPPDDRPEREKDIWKLDMLGVELRKNPIKNIKTLNFSKIPQDVIRQEVKDAAFMELQTSAVGTVLAELVSLNRFCKYLDENEPEIVSLLEVERDIIEGYLIYLNTEANSRQSYRSDLFHLKTMLDLVRRMSGKTELTNIFMQSDIPKEPEKLYRSYSDEEIIRFNGVIVELDVQVARALILHQMLGTRISETLTLRQDCVEERNGKKVIKIGQVKSRRSYHKPINDDVLAIINAAIAYTQEKVPDSPYLFAYEKDAKRPMTYAKIQYQLMALVVDNDLRDEYGERYGVGTHLFRHTYGRKLTEMHYEDTKIAKLLGHANNSSVKYYRKMSNTQMLEESREMRQGMDEILKNLIKEW